MTEGGVCCCGSRQSCLCMSVERCSPAADEKVGARLRQVLRHKRAPACHDLADHLQAHFL